MTPDWRKFAPKEFSTFCARTGMYSEHTDQEIKNVLAREREARLNVAEESTGQSRGMRRDPFKLLWLKVVQIGMDSLCNLFPGWFQANEMCGT